MKSVQQVIKDHDDLKKSVKSYLLLWEEYYKTNDEDILWNLRKRMNMIRNELKLKVK